MVESPVSRSSISGWTKPVSTPPRCSMWVTYRLLTSMAHRPQESAPCCTTLMTNMTPTGAPMPDTTVGPTTGSPT